MNLVINNIQFKDCEHIHEVSKWNAAWIRHAEDLLIIHLLDNG